MKEKEKKRMSPLLILLMLLLLIMHKKMHIKKIQELMILKIRNRFRLHNLAQNQHLPAHGEAVLAARRQQGCN